MVQRKSVTQFGATVELSDNDAFKALVGKVATGGAAQTEKLATAFVEGAADHSEDPKKLDDAMKLAYDPVRKAIEKKVQQKATEANRQAQNAWRSAKTAVDKMVRERAQELREKQKEEAASKELADRYAQEANVYWNRIQAAGVGTADFGAPLEFLKVQGFVTLQKPHRCFLSSYEKDGYGARENGKFGISSVITPSAKIAAPGPELVLHMHCLKSGAVKSAGLKYKNAERLPGANVVLENLTFLSLDFGLTGENVETEIGAFN